MKKWHRASKINRLIIVGILMVCVTCMLCAQPITTTIQAATIQNTTTKQSQQKINLSKGYKQVATSEQLELWCDQSKGTIAVKDKRNGYIWESTVNEDYYPTDSLNVQWQNYLQSPIVINYINLEKRDTPPSRAYSSADAEVIQVAIVDQGIELTYKFEAIGITLVVQYMIENDQLVVKIPAEGLKEEVVLEKPATGTVQKDKLVEVSYGVVSVEVLPFLGAANNEEKGYLFYPDGCGGLTYYDQVENRPANVKMAKWFAYSDIKVNIDEIKDPVKGDRYTATLPVFGIKNNDNALLAAVTQGIEQTSITVYPSGYVVDLNHSNFEFFLRQQYDINMSNVSVDGNNLGKVVTRVEKEKANIDIEMRYFMLADEVANYSGMAAAYRTYLVNENLIKKSIQEGDKMPLSLTFFMGITEEMMIFDRYIPVTTLQNVIDISDELQAQDIENANFILRGWQKGGYGKYPINWPADNKIGGKKGIKTIDEYLEQVEYNVFLENNFIFADKKNKNFSSRDDVAVSASNIPIMSQDSESFILNPTAALQRNTQFLKQTKNYSNLNVAYEDLGEIIYHDYHSQNPATRTETADIWKQVLVDTLDEGKKVAVEGSNQYTYAYADYLYNVPTDTFGYFITDEQVPFVQMVLSGLIPYSSNPGNLAYDLELQKLNWIEFGCIPHFELTYQNSMALKNTDYNKLFSSSYEHWKQTVVEVYKEFEQQLSCVYGAQMIGHEKLNQDVVKVTYSNGIEIIINYSEDTYHYKQQKVAGKSYLVVQ